MKQTEFNSCNVSHTFVVCAYKESPYLEECILSLVNQSVKSNIIIATSTPNKHIYSLAEKYSIRVYERDGKPDIQDDWNFAYNIVDTDLVTIAHQDDIYDKKYYETICKYYEDKNIQIIFFTDYREIKNGNLSSLNANLKIKLLMLFPLRFKIMRGIKFVRKRVLSFGSPICCPSVTYNKKYILGEVFTSKYKCSLDWDTWYKLSKNQGEFVYINQELVFHRIHEQSETTNSIENNVRQMEDYDMFRKFWPKKVALLLSKLYGNSLKSNKM